MYTPDRYKNKNNKELLEVIRKNPFGILVLYDGDKPVATHIPMILQEESGRLVLTGHVAKENEQGQLFHSSPNALAIFQGPHAYISSSWYNHNNVSTWNYIAVHVYGKIRVLNELDLYRHLIQLTNHFEEKSAKPKFFEDIGPKTVRENITGITGFAILIEALESSFKLSQNRDDADHANIIRELENSGDANALGVAEEMRKHGHE